MKHAEITPSACILAAFLLLTVPLRWLLAAWTAAFFHELCHIAAVRACGGSVLGIRVGAGGAVLDTSSMTAGREMFCALAGPFGSFLLLLLLWRIPKLAICGCIQGFYNLLPLYPLDGGRAFRCVFLLSGEKGKRIIKVTEKILWGLIFGSLFLLLFRCSLAVVWICFLCFLIILRKSSCKPVRQRVQ